MTKFILGVITATAILAAYNVYAESVNVSAKVSLTNDNCMASIKQCYCQFE